MKMLGSYGAGDIGRMIASAAGYSAGAYADTTRAHLGWTPRLSLRQGIADALLITAKV